MEKLSLVQVGLVGAGGAIGAIFRYQLGLWLIQIFAWQIPYPIFAINALGALCIGILFFLLKIQSGSLFLFLAVGILGGFTTYSSLCLEVAVLAKEGQFARALLNLFSHFMVCFLFFALGIYLFLKK